LYIIYIYIHINTFVYTPPCIYIYIGIYIQYYIQREGASNLNMLKRASNFDGSSKAKSTNVHVLPQALAVVGIWFN